MIRIGDPSGWPRRMVFHPGFLWTALLSTAIAPVSSLLAAGPSAVHHSALPIGFEPSGAGGYRSQGGRQTVELKAGEVAINGPAGAIVMTFPGSASVAPVADDSRPSDRKSVV